MEDNGIILIDSSDEEGPPCKIRRVSKKNSSTDTERYSQYKETAELKIENIDDEVVIIDDRKSFENKYSVANKEQNVFISAQNDSIKLIKRIELTTLKNNITKELTLPSNDKDENISCDLTHLNGDDKACIDSCTKENNTATTSSADELEDVTSTEFEAFLTECSLCNCDIKYKTMILKKIPSMKRKYIEADKDFVNSEKFKKYIISKAEKLQQKPLDAIIIFNDVYRELESKKFRNVNLTERETLHLKKLYIAMKKVNKMVKHFENKPVNFNEDNNSSYIKLERYKERLCNIHKKICSITKENFYSGRYLYRNLDFSCSKYFEMNRAIDKLYNKKRQFLTYFEVDHCIRKCVQKHNLNFTEDNLNKEIRSIFTAVGNILQRRRKMELYDSLSYYLEGSECDPADNDAEFEALLQCRQAENEKKIDDVLQKYTDRQERGEDPAMSSDSDDSHHISDDSDS